VATNDNLAASGLMTLGEVAAYSQAKNLLPGALLCCADMALTEDAFRSGGKNAPAVGFLRWKDIGIDDREGRVPDTQRGRFAVAPGRGISMFIKKVLPQSMTWLGPIPTPKGQRRQYEQEYSTLRELYWWQLARRQVLPTGLVLVYDGLPPGHCILTVARETTVRGFLSLVSQIRFQSAGADLLGVRRGN